VASGRENWFSLRRPPSETTRRRRHFCLKWLMQSAARKELTRPVNKYDQAGGQAGAEERVKGERPPYTRGDKLPCFHARNISP